MFILRASAVRNERGESPSLDALYHPASLREARRRLLIIWAFAIAWVPTLAVSWLPVLALPAVFLALVLPLTAIVVAIGTLVGAEWLGSPIRPWVACAIPVAAIGFVLAVIVVP
jgi:hypothetical protein